MPKTLKFRYAGERTHDPVLGLLEPGTEGQGEHAIVAVKIAAGLLEAVDHDGRDAADAILDANRREAAALERTPAPPASAPNDSDTDH